MALSTQVRAFPWKYDVFLSFRGEDTRRGFTHYLYKELTRRGITTFRDNPDLERGTAVSSELLSEIEHSRFAIVVLSPHYASSSWCLLELSKILQCMEERGTILPVFYEVDPSHVRHQRGSFAEAFYEHEEKPGGDSKEVEGWRDALTKVANFAGWSSKDFRYETELIKVIVQYLWTKVRSSLRSFGSSELVGMDTKLEGIDVLLDKEANDVRFVGIWGMGGLGKTTLARRIYENISDQFEVCIFLSNVREVSKTHGLFHLQKQMLSQILKEENVQVWDVYSGITMTKRCLGNKAALLVLDDVDQEEQLETLVGGKLWFGLRSRIIITTRNLHVLVRHGIEKPYELKGLNDAEALKLFSLKAFKKYEPEEDYAKQSKSFVDYAGGLPLALKTLGSFLYRRSQPEWSSALENLRNTPNKIVFDLLKVSYDGLNEMQKKIFLDIACFSLKYDAKFIVELVYSYDIHTCIDIQILIDESLLTISSHNNEISIHDLIREMGYEIVRQESSEEAGGRSRLWLREDIFHVFRMNRGTEAIEGIFLHLHKLEEADWNLDAFSKMCRLKLLYIHNLRLSSGPKYLPDALRFLKWSWYPSKSLPPGFQPDELTVLSLIHSNIDHLWKGIKYLGMLKSMDLSHSLNLTRTPDFTGTPNLEKLVLEGCTNLVKIHPSIALLKRLRIWNFRNCKSIKSLPSKVEMESLETFDVSGCSKLEMVPEFVWQMKRLSKLRLGGTAVGKLPSSFEHLSESLEELDLSGIVIREPSYSLFLKENLRVSSFGLFARKSSHPMIPLLSSLKHFSSLTSLNLKDCNLCEREIPNDIDSLSSLEELDLGGNNFVTLPESIPLLSNLKYLDVQNCKRLQTLPDLPCDRRLFLRADNCSSLQLFQNPSNWQRSISAVNCASAVNQDGSYFLYPFLKRLLKQGTNLSDLGEFNFMIPGSEIPEWFNNQSVGDSVIGKIPTYACDRNWIGFAVCALFVPQHNPPAVPDQEFGFMCEWGPHGRTNSFCHGVKLIVSDHLALFVLPSDWLREYRKNDTCNEVEFYFSIWRKEVYGVVPCSSNMKVKKCGARALYEHDMEELIMNQS